MRKLTLLFCPTCNVNVLPERLMGGYLRCPTCYDPFDGDMGGMELLRVLMAEQAELCAQKDGDYAGTSKSFGNFGRVASILALYPDLPMADPIAVLCVYALKHLDCVLHSLETGANLMEGIDSRLQDLSIYFAIARVLSRERDANA